MDLAQIEMIRRLFHDGTPAGFMPRLRRLRCELRNTETRDAWDAMVAYIREAEEGSEK